MNAQVQSHRGTRQLFAIGMAILAMLMMGLFQPVGAQQDPVSCGTFRVPAAAQDELARNPGLAPVLDADGNGIACDEEFEGGPPPEFDFVSCGHYDTQAFAQEALEANPEFAISLDPDGNGIACEGVFDEGPPPVVDPVSCGHFETQEDAQDALDALDKWTTDAESLDPDGNGIACEGVFDPRDPEVDILACSTFKSQEQAQYFLETYGEQWSILDPDGNGIACEEEFGTGPSVVVVCNEALGTLVEVSQVALDQYSIDFPFHRATKAEIAAGKCAATPEVPKAPSVVICDLSRGEMLEVSPEMLEGGTRSFPSRLATEAEIASNKCPITAPAAPGDDEKLATGKPGMVSQLPSTGSGASEVQGRQAPLAAVAVPLALILSGLALQLRNRRSLG